MFPVRSGYPRGIGLSEIGDAGLSAIETTVRPVRSITEKEMLTSIERIVFVYAEWYKRKRDIVAATTEALSGAGRLC